MNYLIHTYWGFLFFGTVVVTWALILAGGIWILKLFDRLKIPQFAGGLLIAACMVAVLVGLFKGISAFDRGVLDRVFVFRSGQGYFLCAWSTRRPGRNQTTYYQLLNSFDLESGRHLASLKLKCVLGRDCYQLGWQGGDKAVLCGPDKDYQLVDLARLKVSPLDEQSRRRMDDLGPALFSMAAKTRWAFAASWRFYSQPGSVGRKVGRRQTPLSKQSALFLKPRLLPELNRQQVKKDRVWICHQSALLSDFQVLISYVEADGRQLDRINLSQLFAKRPATALATFTTDGYVYVIVGCGRKPFSGPFEVYGLEALKTDRQSGRLLARIRYF